MRARFHATMTSALLLCLPAAATAEGPRFAAVLSTAQEVPTPAPGAIEAATVRADFDAALTRVDVVLRVRGGRNVMAAHFHCARAGETGPVAFGLFSPGPLDFDGETARGRLTNADFTGADCNGAIGRSVRNIAALAIAMRDGLIYTNVHTTENAPGEVRGQMFPVDGGDGDDGGRGRARRDRDGDENEDD